MKKRFLLSLSFLIIGVIIYFIFDIRFISKSNIIFSIIRNYMPDMCWTFSFFFLSINFTKNITKYNLLINSTYVFCIAMIYEFLQYFHIVNGTFDFIDISIYIFSIIIACLIEKIIRRKENDKR